MAHVLVSLISDHLIPNLLLMGELPDIDKYIFLSSEFMESKGKSESLAKSMGLTDDQFLEPVLLEQDSLSDIEEKLKALDLDKNDKFYVNVTGGTKIMSIGVYNFFSRLNAEIYYVYIGKNHYRQIHPMVKDDERILYYKPSLEEYLTCYGISIIKPEKINLLCCPVSYTLSFYKKFKSFTQSDFECLSQLRFLRNHKEFKKKKKMNIIPEIAEKLTEWNFPVKNPGELDSTEVDYLTGGWFEEYVYNWMKEFLNLEDKEIGLGVKILRNNVDNECDVLFIYKHTMYMIECKTGLWDAATKKSFLNETVYKIESISRDFGIRVKSFLFTTVEAERISKSSYERAAHFNVKIIDNSVLTSREKRSELMMQLK